MKLKTIVNEVKDGAISSVTLIVYDEKVMLEIDLSIEYAVASIDAVRLFEDDLCESVELIKDELKDRGIAKVKYNNIDYDVDALELR